MSDQSMKMSNDQVDRLGDRIADKLSECFNRRERRQPDKISGGRQWQRGKGRGYGGKGASPAKQQWARIATCYLCYAYGHTASDHDIHWPLSADMDKRYNLGKKWHGVCSRLAEDEVGEMRSFQDVAKDVGVDLSDLDLRDVGQKRGLALVIWKKTGMESWLPIEKIGTYMAGHDITTPDAIKMTQIHEVSDDDLSQPDRASSSTSRKKSSKSLSRDLNHEFTSAWKQQVDGKLETLEKSVETLGEKHSRSHRMMKLMLQLQGVAPDQLQAALDGSDEDMDRDLFDAGPSPPAMAAPKRKWNDAAADPVSAAEMPLDVLKAEVCAIHPEGAAQALKLRTRCEIVWVLAQLFPKGVFVSVSHSKAKREKWEPCLFDEDMVVVAVRVVCKATTEGCVIVAPGERPSAVVWNIPPWRENAGTEMSLQKIWGTEQAAPRSSKGLTSPAKRRRGADGNDDA